MRKQGIVKPCTKIYGCRAIGRRKTMENNKILDSIRDTLSIFDTKDKVTEICMLGTNKGVIRGYYYNSDDKLIEDITPYIQKYSIYMTINPLKQDLLARASNKLELYAKTRASDQDIESLRYLHIDLDPVRITGVSATDEELEYSKTKANEIKRFLEQQYDIKNPIGSISGNGFNLDYYLELESTKENVDLLRNCLKALDFKFSDDKVKVDTTTYNPSRIIKLFGSLSCKGDNTEERPHRYSSIQEVPEEMFIIEKEQLLELTKLLPVSVENKLSNKSKSINLDEWLQEKGLEIYDKAPYGDGIIYKFEVCPWNGSHVDKSAYAIQYDSGAIMARCHHDSCKDNNWKTLKALFDKNTQESDDGKVSIASRLVDLGCENAEFFENEIGESYVAIDNGEYKETMKIKSSRYRKMLTKLFYEAEGKPIKTDAMNQAISVFEMKSTFSGKTRKLEKRISSYENDMYYDLGDDKWKAIKITNKGCLIEEKSPILFARGANMKQQVTPNFDVSADKLLKLLDKHFRFKENEDKILFIAYLVSCLVAGIPHPILVLFGEKGAAKSTTMKMIRSIIDPAKNDLLSLPTSKTDLALSLANNYMPSFDNLDTISPEKSDMLCMAATGGSFSRRMLYTDEDEVIVSFKRCVVLNGINVVASRADLLDRAIVLELERISESDRKTEKEVWEDFELDMPIILGACFRTLSKAMEIQPTIGLDKLGRMADFTIWGYAIAEAVGIGGENFLEAYLKNQSRANEEAIFSNPLAASVVAFMSKKKNWIGSVSEFLGGLEDIACLEKINTNNRVFPNAPHVLSKRLKEVKSNLEQVGISFDIRHSGNYKKITVVNNNFRQ